MFSNEREIEVGDIIQFHENVRDQVWVGIVMSDDTVDRREVRVRWWFSKKQSWSALQTIPRSMLYLIGPVPEWAEWDV